MSSSGRAAYQSVNSTVISNNLESIRLEFNDPVFQILQVVCQDTLTEEETEKVKLHAKFVECLNTVMMMMMLGI